MTRSLSPEELARSRENSRWLKEQREDRIRGEINYSLQQTIERMWKLPRYYKQEANRQLRLPLGIP